MWRKWLSGLAVAGCAVSAQADDKGPLLVIERLQFSQGTLPRDDNWLGLFCAAQDCELRAAAVSITDGTAKDITDSDEGLEVVGVEGDALALFHGVPLAPARVTTWYRAPDEPYRSRQYTSLLKLGHWAVPGGAQPLSLSWVKLPDGAGFHYFLGDGSRKQFLFSTPAEGHYGGDLTPIVHWVGDLDGDGKPDLLLSLPDDNCGYDQRLYLSSQAVNGELVHRAAVLSGYEAACGC